MEKPEQFGRNSNPKELDEQEQLKKLEADAKAARMAGVYNPNESEEDK